MDELGGRVSQMMEVVERNGRPTPSALHRFEYEKVKTFESSPPPQSTKWAPCLERLGKRARWVDREVGNLEGMVIESTVVASRRDEETTTFRRQYRPVTFRFRQKLVCCRSVCVT